MEVSIKTLDHALPVVLALGNIIKFLLHICRESIVHNLVEILLQIIIHNNAHIGRNDFVFLIAEFLFLCFFFYHIVFQDDARIGTFTARAGCLLDITTLLNGGNGGRVCGRTADAEFLEFLHQTCFGVTCRGLSKTLGGGDHLCTQSLSQLHSRQHAAHFLVVVILGFSVNLEESGEQNHFTRSNEFLLAAGNRNRDVGFLRLGIAHLGSNGTFPYQLIEMLGESVARDGLTRQVRRTNCLVSFLSTFGLGDIVMDMDIRCSEHLRDHILGRS